MNRSSWIWYVFILISAGLVLSFSFVGRFNTKNKVGKADFELVKLYRAEEVCRPLQEPCAAYSNDAAVVIRLYPIKEVYRVQVKTVGMRGDNVGAMESILLDNAGSKIGEPSQLKGSLDAGYEGEIRMVAKAHSVRISFKHNDKLAVADLPLL